MMTAAATIGATRAQWARVLRPAAPSCDSWFMTGRILAFAGAVLLAVVGAGAQELRGRLVGAVTDATGAVFQASPQLPRARL